jgi:DNA polymerase I-like protein with 3'-5' exonuclease and polymerase domains
MKGDSPQGGSLFGEKMENIIFDFESFYDDDLTVKRYGALNYFSQTSAYLVSVVGDDFEWVGNPLSFDWSRLADAQVWAHNFGFDGAYFLSRELPLPGQTFNCSANLVAWLGAPRKLDTAERLLLGSEECSKDVRAAMKGRTWHSLDKSEHDVVTAYALTDSRVAKRLVDRFVSEWPVHEQELSRHTIQMGWHGVGLDKEKLALYLARAEEIAAAAGVGIPWVPDEKALSIPQARAQCEKSGILPPPSFNQKDEGFLQWEALHKARVPWVGAVSRHRQATLMLRRLEAMERRLIPGGRLSYSLRYFGAHTGRFAGGDGLNLQNMRKSEFHGIRLRSLLVPAPGKKLIIADLAQIEPRCLAWLCGDERLLGLMRAGWSYYEAQAKSWNLWDGQKGSLKPACREVYEAVKRLSLGAGYGMGPARFRAVVLAEMGVAMSLDEARRQLVDYRRRNPKVVAYWNRFTRQVQMSVGDGEFSIELPSGRTLHYRGLIRRGNDVCCNLATEEGFRESRLWGGLLTENVVSGVARDTFTWQIPRLEASGWRVVAHIHDEYVLEVAPDVKVGDVVALLRTPPPWASDLPQDASAWEGGCYAK